MNKATVENKYCPIEDLLPKAVAEDIKPLAELCGSPSFQSNVSNHFIT